VPAPLAQTALQAQVALWEALALEQRLVRDQEPAVEAAAALRAPVFLSLRPLLCPPVEREPSLPAGDSRPSLCTWDTE
jgi:hypothetical protein